MRYLRKFFLSESGVAVWFFKCILVEDGWQQEDHRTLTFSASRSWSLSLKWSKPSSRLWVTYTTNLTHIIRKSQVCQEESSRTIPPSSIVLLVCPPSPLLSGWQFQVCSWELPCICFKYRTNTDWRYGGGPKGWDGLVVAGTPSCRCLQDLATEFLGGRLSQSLEVRRERAGEWHWWLAWNSVSWTLRQYLRPCQADCSGGWLTMNIPAGGQNLINLMDLISAQNLSALPHNIRQWDSLESSLRHWQIALRCLVT